MVIYENEEIWNKVMEKGRKIEDYGYLPSRYGEDPEPDVKNRFSKADVETVIGTLAFFQVNDNFIKQTIFDLWRAKYRLFEWIAMLNTGRNIGYPREDVIERIRAVILTKVFSDIYLLEPLTDPKQFIQFLREWDLQTVIERKLEYIKHEEELEGKQYMVIDFQEYQLPNLWSDPNITDFRKIAPQAWIFNIEGNLRYVKAST
jgi:hypothetical protein